MGTAEAQTGDPLALYPQAEINAKAIRRYYEKSEEGEAKKGANSA
jgi:hypothetical protein